MLDAAFPHLAPYPGKRALLRQELGQGHSDTSRLDILALTPDSSTLPSAPAKISEFSRWRIGPYPNYTDAAFFNGRGRICVACYGDGRVYEVDRTTGLVTHFSTGSGTYPIDVKYDKRRQRIVAASADGHAKLVILEGTNRTTLPLAPYAEQGECDGGVQGIAVDADGDYWASLAYSGKKDLGVVVKLSGDTLEPLRLIQNVGLDNPNGVSVSDDGKRVYVFSHNGYAHEFDLAGNVQRRLATVLTGYRGTVRGEFLWTCAWHTPGKMSRVNLQTGENTKYACIALANSIALDLAGNVWVAGDGGVSVSSSDGDLLATATWNAFTNGLSVLDNDVFFASSTQSLHGVNLMDRPLFLPLIHAA